MNKRSLSSVFLFGMLLSGPSQAGLKAIVEETSEQSEKVVKLEKFDGVWKGSEALQTVIIIKQIGERLYIHGQDKESSWQGIGIFREEGIIVTGRGTHLSKGDFAYQSTLQWKEGVLIDSWSAVFPEETIEGVDKLTPVLLFPAEQTNESK